jgi:hypothetical protein
LLFHVKKTSLSFPEVLHFLQKDVIASQSPERSEGAAKQSLGYAKRDCFVGVYPEPVEGLLTMTDPAETG